MKPNVTVMGTLRRMERTSEGLEIQFPLMIEHLSLFGFTHLSPGAYKDLGYRDSYLGKIEETVTTLEQNCLSMFKRKNITNTDV